MDPVRRLSIVKCINSLVHSSGCRLAACEVQSCAKMKRIINHAKVCRRQTRGGCTICKQLIALCCYHAKHCQETNCQVPFCASIKHKLNQLSATRRLQQNQELFRRRMVLMMQMGQSTSARRPVSLTLTESQQLLRTQPIKIREILNNSVERSKRTNRLTPAAK